MIAQDIEKHMTSNGPTMATISNLYTKAEGHSLHDLIALTAWATGQDQQRIVGRRRHVPVVKARSIAVKVARRFYSLNQIGCALGRDHTSVINLLQTFDEFAGIDQHFQQCYKRVLYNL